MKNCTGIFCPMQYDKVDPATCQAVDYCPQATPPKTNADRIRAMTNEELAAWLDDRSIIPCKEVWLDWLKQEVK